jgi:hypothetical protein
MRNLNAIREVRERERARWPLNGDGNRECEKHGYVLKPDDWACGECADHDRRTRDAEIARQQRRARVEAWFTQSSAAADGLGGLPRSDYARFANKSWLEKRDRRIVRELRAWDLRCWKFISGSTGAGKTSTLVAKLFETQEKLLAAADRGPVEIPPKFFYCTGPDLVEAEKRRRLGDYPHAAVVAAQERPILILDEINRASVELVFAIVDARTRAALTTVALCGMPPREFGCTYGANVLRRFVDAGSILDAFGGGTEK